MFPRAHILSILVAALVLPSGTSFAQVCLAPGQALECSGMDCDVTAGPESGQQHEVVEATRRLRVRAIDSNLSTESSYAELHAFVVEPNADLFLRAHADVSFAGFLTGFGGGVVNFGSVEILAIVRDLDSGDVVASSVIAEETNQGSFGMGGPSSFENIPFGPPARRDVPHSGDQGVRLEAGRAYGIGIGARAEARGGAINNGESDYFTGNQGVFLNALRLITWPDQSVAGFEDDDGDGLVNVWETDGIRDCEGTMLLDLPGMGASPDHKDLFVELDWLDGREPSARAIQTVKDSFAAAPIDAGGIANPDGLRGIRLWVDTGGLTDSSGALVGDDFGGGTEIPVADIPDPAGQFIPPLSEGVGGLPYTVDIDGNGQTDFYEVKRRNFDLIRTRVFRYSISARARDEVGNQYPGGQAELGGDDSVGFSLLPVVLMHELGHNLGLDHGGDEGLNCKPNHVSIMNYALVGGIPRRSMDAQVQDIDNDGDLDARILDFSPPRFPGGRGAAPIFAEGDGLVESTLSETRVLDPTDTANATRYFNDAGEGRDLNLDEQPNWNGGTVSDDTVSQDINASSEVPGCDSAPEVGLSTLGGHDDWGALQFPIEIDGIVEELAENQSGTTPVPEEPDPTADQIRDIEAEFNTLDLSVTKSITPDLVMAGQEIVYEITVTNQGPNAALEVIVEDQLPDLVTPVDMPETCSLDEDGLLTCALDVIAEGESSVLSLPVRVAPRLPCGDADTVRLVNRVSVRNGEWSDTNPEDNMAEAESEAICLRFEYAAKFVCGEGEEPGSLLVAPGRYRTIVNIHNFQSRPVPFFKKLALAYPPAEQAPGAVLPIGIDRLEYDEALKADCEDLRRRLFDGALPGGLIEGYLVVQSPRRLDVDAFYSAAAPSSDGTPGPARSIDVESVAERDLRTDLAIEKTSQVFPIPLGQGSDAPSQFRLFATLYTVRVFNGGAVHAENLEISDTVSLALGGASVGAVLIPQDPFEIPDGATLGPIQGTPFPPSAGFTVTLPELAPEGATQIRFWALTLIYLSNPQDPASGATLVNRAEVSSQGPDTTAIDNTVETLDVLVD